VRFGTGYHEQNGSRRVREVQWRLTELGYHTGPIDGLYGPLTRSAVQWFQIKHGLRPTGVVAATTLLTLRDPKALTRPPSQALAKAPRTQTPAAPQPHPAPLESNDNLGWLVAPLIALLATLLVLGLLALVRRRMRARAFERELEMPDMPPRVPLSLTGGASYRELGVPVLGYVALDETAALTHESAIESACDDRGWTLTRLVRDSHSDHGGPLDRPGLSYALEQLEEGHAERLVVDRLDHVARSVAELSSVLGWFSSTGVALTALDVGLDTGTPEGRAAARTLLRVGEVEQTRADARRQSSGLRVVPGHSRPAVTDPKLADEIRQMRAGGMSLQAIADALNDEGVPAVLGVARWRPSSVRAVLGYKRPRAEQW
jgi:DNA invertase Pin-like site-specific DNA recombinase